MSSSIAAAANRGAPQCRGMFARQLDVLRSLRRGARTNAGAVLGALGAGDLIAAMTRIRGATVIMYHSVAAGKNVGWIHPNNRMTPTLFERHVRFLARRRRVISLFDLVSRLQSGIDPDPGTVVITFDDGYVDNLRVAYPILERYGLPATIFLPTAYIEEEKAPWSDQLYSILQRRTKRRLVVHIGGAERMFDLGRASAWKSAYAELASYLIALSFDERSKLLSEVAQQLKPLGNPARVTMNWYEVARISKRFPNVEVGSHSVNHTDLSAQERLNVLNELRLSKARLEDILGSAVRFFAFPYNRVAPGILGDLAELGYAAAVGSHSSPLISTRTQWACMTRVEVNRGIGHLSYVTSGAVGYREVPERGARHGYTGEVK
jgi:peptidoglycan/xylan/chitin deacetylase (PgdA/CDA1 family)